MGKSRNVGVVCLWKDSFEMNATLYQVSGTLGPLDSY